MRTRGLILAAALALAGCDYFGTTDEGEPAQGPPGLGAPAGCAGTSVVVAPGGGTTAPVSDPILVALSIDPDDEVPFITPIWARFDRATNVLITLRDDTGEVLPGVLTAESATRFEYTPDEPLEPMSAYSIEIDWTVDGISYDFTTNALGNPASESAFAGGLYVVDLGGLTLSEPPGVGAIVASQVDGIPLFVSLEGTRGGRRAGPPRLLVRMFLRTPCFPSGRIFEPAELWWDNPRGWMTPTDHPEGTPISGGLVWDVAVEGWVHPDGDTIEGLSLSAIVDSTPGDALVVTEEDPEPEEGALCDFLFEVIGLQCEPCPEGDSEWCLDVRAERMTAHRLSTLTDWQRSDLGLLEVDPDITFDDIVAAYQEAALEDPDCPQAIPADCSFDFSCSASVVGPGSVVPALALLLLGRRRRR
ncbi:MAG: Ig-like domain-containing protein [Proteobacteria bacterium]|nr:Ig-like domain-containing protein [Pseudomonadota bacterium]